MKYNLTDKQPTNSKLQQIKTTKHTEQNGTILTKANIFTKTTHSSRSYLLPLLLLELCNTQHKEAVINGVKSQIFCT